MEDSIAELMAGYVLGNLSPEEQAFLEDYLKNHPEAHQEINALERTLALVPFALPEPSPAPKLQAKFTGRKILTILAIGLGVLLTIGSTWQNYQLRQQIAQFQKAIEFPDNRLIGLNSMDVKHKSMGSLIINPRMGQGILAIQNLAPPPKGNRYTLWIVGQQGEKVFCQDFIPDREGRVMVTVPIDPTMVYTKEVAITLEPEGNSIVPKGEMVIQGTAI